MNEGYWNEDFEKPYEKVNVDALMRALVIATDALEYEANVPRWPSAKAAEALKEIDLILK